MHDSWFVLGQIGFEAEFHPFTLKLLESWFDCIHSHSHIYHAILVVFIKQPLQGD